MSNITTWLDLTSTNNNQKVASIIAVEQEIVEVILTVAIMGRSAAEPLTTTRNTCSTSINKM